MVCTPQLLCFPGPMRLQTVGRQHQLPSGKLFNQNTSPVRIPRMTMNNLGVLGGSSHHLVAVQSTKELVEPGILSLGRSCICNSLYAESIGTPPLFPECIDLHPMMLG